MSGSNPSAIPPPPNSVPSTGNFFHDSIEAAKNVEKLPCSRNSLLTGLAAGTGVAFIRGVSVAPIVAGHWFTFTFVAVAAISHQVCIRQMDAERKKVMQIIETAPKRPPPKDETLSPN